MEGNKSGGKSGVKKIAESDETGVDVFMAKGVPWKPNPEKRFVKQDFQKPKSGNDPRDQSSQGGFKEGGERSTTLGDQGNWHGVAGSGRGKSWDTTNEANQNQGFPAQGEKQKIQGESVGSQNWYDGCRTCRGLGLEYMHDWRKCARAQEIYWKNKSRMQKKGGKSFSRSNSRPPTPEGERKQ